MNLDLAYKKLIWIKQECGGSVDSKPSSSSVDKGSFEYHRHQMHLLIKETRRLLEEGCNLALCPDSIASLQQRKRKAEVSHAVRKKLQLATELLNVMQMIANQDGRKAKNSPQSSIANKERNECLQICQMHISECTSLLNELGGGPAGDSASRSALAKAYGRPGNLAGFKITHSELPDIDIERDFENIQKTQADIEHELVEICSGVRGLKEIALDIEKNVDQQQEAITELNGKAANTEQKMENLNVRLKKTLEKVMKGDKFIINVTLVLILLGLLYFLSGFIKK